MLRPKPYEGQTMTAATPDNPVGEFQTPGAYDNGLKAALIQTIAALPAKLRSTVAGLTDQQLDSPYRNWSVRQIVHHLADSHIHSYVRFKWTLTEDSPTIKAYEEGDWAVLADSKQADVSTSLLLLDGLHARWVFALESMSAEQFARTFHHPQSGEHVSLWTALNYYAWHGEHHTGQIQWLREHRFAG